MPTFLRPTHLHEELGVTPDPSTRTCANCPSALSSSDVSQITGRAIGAPVCGIKRIPLIAPNQPNKVRARTMEATASKCDSYGKPRPEFSASPDTPIAYGSVGMMKPLKASDAVRLKPPNCMSCVFFIQPREVAPSTGWSAGLCAKKGKLLTQDRLRAYAKACTEGRQREPGDVLASMDTFMLNLEYSPTFGEIDQSKIARKTRETEPYDWPTDKPVTPQDEKNGIKAWRRVIDPEGEGADAYLPVLRREILHEKDLELVPRTGDDERPEEYRDHSGILYQATVLMVELKAIPAFWGIPGVGKTELGRYIAWLMSAPFARISVNGQSDIDELAGKTLYSPEKGTYFHYGRLPTRWERPGVTVLDEPNTGPPEVWQFIRPITDDSKQLVLDQNEGERIKRNLWSLLMLAMNPAHDARNVGTNTIGDADARRLMHVWMGLPPEDVEKDIIRARVMSVDGYDPTPHLDKLMKISKDLRPMCDEGSLPMTWGPSMNIKVGRLLKFFDPLRAFQLAIVNHLDPAATTSVLNVVKTVYKI